MTGAFVLPVLPTLPASEVRKESDRFRCEPYKATITARACVQRRQAAMGVGAKARPGEALRRDSTSHRGDLGLCRKCPVGPDIAAAVGELAAELEPVAIIPAPMAARAAIRKPKAEVAMPAKALVNPTRRGARLQFDEELREANAEGTGREGGPVAPVNGGREPTDDAPSSERKRVVPPKAAKGDGKAKEGVRAKRARIRAELEAKEKQRGERARAAEELEAAKLPPGRKRASPKHRTCSLCDTVGHDSRVCPTRGKAKPRPSIAAELRRRMKEGGLSLRGVAEVSGVSAPVVQRILAGNTVPKGSTLEKLRAWLDGAIVTRAELEAPTAEVPGLLGRVTRWREEGQELRRELEEALGALDVQAGQLRPLLDMLTPKPTAAMRAELARDPAWSGRTTFTREDLEQRKPDGPRPRGVQPYDPGDVVRVRYGTCTGRTGRVVACVKKSNRAWWVTLARLSGDKGKLPSSTRAAYVELVKRGR